MIDMGRSDTAEPHVSRTNLASVLGDVAKLSPEQLKVLERYLKYTKRSSAPARLSSSLERAAKRMLANIGGCIQIADVAKECSLSRSHFSRAFKNTTGLSPRDWLQQARLTQAKALLEQTDFPISHVGLECGFADQPHFTRIFSRRYGMTPGQLRAKTVGIGRKSRSQTADKFCSS